MEQAIEVVCNIDDRLNALHLNLLIEENEIPHFEAVGLTPFQRMLKSLLECVATKTHREVIYQNVENRCGILGLDVNPASIQALTANQLHAAGARLGKERVVTAFVNLYNDDFVEMEDDVFYQVITGIEGLGDFTFFQVNVFGRNRFNYIPTCYKFRRALRWFEQQFGNMGDIVDATPTPIQTIQRSQIWAPRQGIAA